MTEINVVRRKELSVSPEIRNERRTYARFISNLAVDIKEPHKPEVCQGTCRDIGAEGAKITLNKKLRPEDRIELSLNIGPNKEPLHLVGNVRWLREVEFNLWDAGIKFHGVDFMMLAPLLRAV